MVCKEVSEVSALNSQNTLDSLNVKRQKHNNNTMRRLLTILLAAMAFVACTQNEVEELSANRADVPETLTVGFEGGDTRIELNEALKTVWTEGC